MTDLVQQYGYYSEGESFTIADPNEIWIMEMGRSLKYSLSSTLKFKGERR